MKKNANVHFEGKHKKVHIMFGYFFLEPVLKELGVYQEEPIICFHDNFAMGPIGQLHEQAGQKRRFEWLKNTMLLSREEFYKNNENIQRVIYQIKSIPVGVPINIWVSENAHEQTGLLFVMYLLREKTNSISIINSTKQFKELFERKAKKYVPFSSGKIIHEELTSIYKNSKKHLKSLTDIERNQVETHWLNFSETFETLRLWENGKITSVSEDYYDEFIIQMAKKLSGKQKKKLFIPSARLIGEVYGQIDQYVGDEFLEYRLRKLIDRRVFEFDGSLEAMHYYRVKLI